MLDVAFFGSHLYALSSHVTHFCSRFRDSLFLSYDYEIHLPPHMAIIKIQQVPMQDEKVRRGNGWKSLFVPLDCVEPRHKLT